MTIPDHFADSREAVLKARELLRRAHAVIFDFDGLLVDTEYAIYSSWERVFASCGHPLPWICSTNAWAAATPTGIPENIWRN